MAQRSSGARECLCPDGAKLVACSLLVLELAPSDGVASARNPPRNIDAEKSMLGSVFIKPSDPLA